jgi:molecular chaperone DnaK
VRNQADSLIHASEKTLAELGDKASGEERHAVEAAISDLKSVLDDGDKATIEAKTSALGEASAAIAQKLYAEQAAQEGGDAASGGPEGKGDDVVDAEFEEVDGDDADKDKDA